MEKKSSDSSLDFLKSDSILIKELFNFNGDEGKLQDLKKSFLNEMSNSPNGPFYFIKLFDYYAQVRSYHSRVVKQLVDCVFFTFWTKH